MVIYLRKFAASGWVRKDNLKMRMVKVLRLTIRKKLVISVIALLIVAIATIAASSIYFLSTSMEASHERSATQGVNSLHWLIEKYEKESARHALVLAGYPGVSQAVQARDGAAFLRIVQPLLKDMNMDMVTVADAQGTVIVRNYDAKSGDSILGQPDVKAALQGNAVSGMEPGTAVKFAIRTTLPVKNEAGQVIGVLQTGYNANREEIVDAVKELFGTEATIFAGDERLSTTIVTNGKRAVGTKLDPAIADKVLKDGQKYTGRANILGTDHLTAYIPLLGTDKKPVGILFAGENIASFYADRNKLGLIIVTITLCLLGIGALCAFALARSIARPINQLAFGVTEVASGNLTHSVTVTSKDELGVLSGTFNSMVSQLRTLVTQVNSQSQSLAASSQQLNASAEQAASASNQVAESIADVAKGADQQLMSVENSSAIIGQMSATIQQIAANAGFVTETSEKTAVAANEGNEAINAAINQMTSIEQKVQVSAAVVEQLGERSKEIGLIVDTISGIAGQTNLLALNAAIEAARAGEQGRGFAVVAEEVRKLAEQSQEAAKQIADLIAGIQTDTTKAVTAMNEGTKEVALGTDVVNAAGKAFSRIAELIGRAADQISEISESINNIAGDSQKVVLSVKEIAEISKGTAGQSQTVSAATEEQSASTEEIASSSAALTQLAEELQEAVRKFKV
jgi:methyl-accepting chemotaxis protein